jgi:uncharacterized DUF497 family protein
MFDLTFEWDEEKNRINQKKHGIGFELAKMVFMDDDRIEIFDEKHSITEKRYNTIGMVNDILYVVYTERNDRIRIISARRATASERSIYYDNHFDSYI